MQRHPKKRIDIIIEAPAVGMLAALLDGMDVSGYSIFPITAGRGHDLAWSVEGQVGTATQMMALICIVDLSVADAVLESVFDVVSRRIGFVTVSDVSVIRSERF